MAATMALTIVQRFKYRGVDEEFSNKYHFHGLAPGDDAGWKALADAVIDALRPTMSGRVSFVRAYGYQVGDDLADAVIDYTAAPLTPKTGTLAPGAGIQLSGDDAFTVRWRTNERNSKGKWIYCRKYFHDVYGSPSDPDLLLSGQKDAAETFAAKMLDGNLPGAVTLCTPDGVDAKIPAVGKYTTTRTLKRRGKRPH